jgi:lysophospholipase L1-like esterase
MRRVLCLGDSNTYGYDPRSYFGSRYPRSVRWTGRLESAGWQVFNCGENGLSIPREWELPETAALIRRFLPLDAVTVMLGSNDLLCGAAAEEAGARMEPLLRCAADSAPEAGLLLIAPPPMAPGEWVPDPSLTEESRRLGAVYRALAEKLGVAFADAGEWGAALAYDGVHLLPEGHAAFARGVLRALEDLSGGRSGG